VQQAQHDFLRDGGFVAKVPGFDLNESTHLTASRFPEFFISRMIEPSDCSMMLCSIAQWCFLNMATLS
jgi:hypothetical protein